MITTNELFETWPETNSTVTFRASQTIPTNIPVTAVKLYAISNNKILLTKVPRGWDIPGGHVEKNESPKQAIYREVIEETGIEISESLLIGYLLIFNEPTEANKRYPRESCILIYGSQNPSTTPSHVITHEATEIAWVPVVDASKYHHNWTSLKDHIAKKVASL